MFQTATVMPEVSDWTSVLQIVLIGAVLIFAIGAIFRGIFGKGSAINRAVSATLSILMVYLAMILLYLFVPDLRGTVNQLPFLTVTADQVQLWDISALSNEALYASLVKMGILAILVNLLESLLPHGKKFFSWYVWRCVTVLAGLFLYIVACGAINALVPQVFGQWAGYVLIGFWAMILLIGIVKVLLSVVLTVVNPVVGALYTFFFSNIVGKQFTKSILTTVLMALIVAGLNNAGLTQFSFSDFSLATYGPTCIIVVVVLYLFGKLL